MYSGNGVNSPIVYTAANDAQLIALSNQLGGSGINTIYGALNYFNLSSTLTCVNIEPPNIVTNGLLLNLDAGITYSYPKSGTTWNNLSSSANTGTLINGPVYSSDAGGSISFDGTNDYMSVPSLSNASFPQSAGTISLWYFMDSTGDFGNKPIFDLPGDLGRRRFTIYSYDRYIVVFSAYYAINGSPPIFTSQFFVGSNTWNHMTLTYTISGNVFVYINGDLRANPINTLNFFPSEQFVGFGSSSSPSAASKGKGFNLMIYNRVLSQAEVLQNYYAGLQKLIPKDNLVLFLDGQNTNTRVIAPITAYDASGNNYDGSFQNGAALSYGVGVATFSFDGIDDVVTTSVNTLSASTTWTVWVNRTESVNDYNMIMGMYLPYFAFRSNGSIHFSNSINGTQQNLVSAQNLANNVWYFMTFVSSFSAGNTTMKIYLNGDLITQQTFAGQQPTTTGNSLRLGGWETGGTYPFKGKIGDVKMYNRELTSTEILNMYLAGIPRYGNRVYRSNLGICCDGSGSINVYSTSDIYFNGVQVGNYLYTNPALTIPLQTNSYDGITQGGCCGDIIVTNSLGLVTSTTTAIPIYCPECGC